MVRRWQRRLALCLCSCWVLPLECVDRLQQMLRWEDSYPALLLAQQYLGRLLDNGDKVAAVKLMLRCRLVDETFRPLRADLEKAIEAAKACDNPDLAEALSRRL